MSYGLSIKKNKKTFVSSIKDNSVSLIDITLELSPILRKRYPHYSPLTGIITHTTPLKVINGVIQNININISKSIVPYKNISSIVPYNFYKK